MSSIKENLDEIRSELGTRIRLVAVSKTHPVESIMEAYQAGQRIFGENRVQEILLKQPNLPADIEWHMIGHLQSNKIKFIAPFITLIHSVDSRKLLQEVSLQAVKWQRVIDCLLQVYIATEETKFGFNRDELIGMLSEMEKHPLPGVRVRGLMGMASFTDDQRLVRQEFRGLRNLFDELRGTFFSDQDTFNELSIGMSGDYHLAVEEGSTLVRIGTRIFGSR